MIKLFGKVSSIKIIKYSEKPLVRFTLETKLGKVNCLICHHSLNFLGDVDEEMYIFIFGRYNKRNQLVVREYQAKTQSKIYYEFEKSLYPRARME